MTAKIIDGQAIANFYRAEYQLRASRLRDAGTVPGLAVVIVGDDAASKVYVRKKAEACESVGIRSTVYALPTTTSHSELLSRIDSLNADANIHGILVQLPLPSGLNDRDVIEAIHPSKDIDGFHYANMGALVIDESRYPPCTPYGVMKILEHEGISVEGKHVVIVGRSNIVGKPQAMLMLKAGATVTICHSKTINLAVHTRMADIVVAAVGRAHFLRGDMLKPGAVVIDVGINRTSEGKLVGDVHFESAREVASAITPVPGGVGPMTIAMLLGNTLRAAEFAAGLREGPSETMIA